MLESRTLNARIGPPNNAITYTGHDEENAAAEIFRPDLPAHPSLGVVAEALRRGYQDRARYLGDPDFVAPAPRRDWDSPRSVELCSDDGEPDEPPLTDEQRAILLIQTHLESVFDDLSGERRALDDDVEPGAGEADFVHPNVKVNQNRLDGILKRLEIAQRLLAAARDREDLPADDRAQIVATYQQAIDALRQAHEAAARAVEFEAETAEAPARLERIRAELARPSEPPSPVPEDGATTEQLEERLAAAEAEAPAAEAPAADAEQA